MLFSSLALGLLLVAANAAQDMPYIRMADLQGVAEPEKAKWIAMSKDVSFLPVDDLPNIKTIRRSLEEEEDVDEEEIEETTGMWEEYNPYSVQPFVKGMGDYDEYQQAWRMLGFMIDCNYVSEGDEDEHRGSGSGDVTEEGCARYILWAAVSRRLSSLA